MDREPSAPASGPVQRLVDFRQQVEILASRAVRADVSESSRDVVSRLQQFQSDLTPRETEVAVIAARAGAYYAATLHAAVELSSGTSSSESRAVARNRIAKLLVGFSEPGQPWERWEGVSRHEAPSVARPVAVTAAVSLGFTPKPGVVLPELAEAVNIPGEHGGPSGAPRRERSSREPPRKSGDRSRSPYHAVRP